MKTSIIFAFHILFFTSIANAQIASEEKPNTHRWLVSFNLGGDLLFFNNKPSPLLKTQKHNNLHGMSEGQGQIEVMYIYKRLVFTTGIDLISQKYTMNNDTWFTDVLTFTPTSAAFYELSYSHTYVSIPVGLGTVISSNRIKRGATVLYVQLVNGFRQSSSTKIKYFDDSTPAQETAVNTFLVTQPQKKHSRRIVLGIGYKWDIKDSGIGISLNLRTVKMLTKVDSEFVDRPFGFGLQFGILHQFD
jgi:hypothetical protein